MKLGFGAMEETRLPQFKGGVGDTIAKMYSDNMNRILYGRLEPGSTIGYHRHETSSEIIYIIKGEGKCLIDDDGEERLSAGDCHYCLKGHSHSLINDSDADLIFFAVVPEQ